MTLDIETPTTAPTIEQRLSDLEGAVSAMHDTVTEMARLLSLIQGSVEPALAGLASSPIAKMMGL